MQDTGIVQLVVDDAINEALESDSLALQNMNGSKYVQVCISSNLRWKFYD